MKSSEHMGRDAKSKIVCGITMGDPSGVGPEVILKALNNAEVKGLADFLVIGDSFVFRKTQSARRTTQGLPLIDLQNLSYKNFAFGRARAEYGKAAMEYLQEAVKLIKLRKIDCLVTAPICKEAINLAGYKFSGQTEFIASAFGIKDAVMMLANKRLKVALVTRHIPLKDVSKNLNKITILKTITITAGSLKSIFNIKNPRLTVCGLNPHASDNGLLGNEEKRLITPAIKKAKAKRIMISGPFPADTVFTKIASDNIDAVICMYHDQGLIPLKLLGFKEAVNITLGLPFVRTSPGHGTAFDIAGKDKADPASFIEAVRLAVKCTQNLRRD